MEEEAVFQPAGARAAPEDQSENRILFTRAKSAGSSLAPASSSAGGSA